MDAVSISNVAVTLECRECGLVFSTAKELSNHKERFCVGCTYNDPENLAAMTKRQLERFKAKGGSRAAGDGAAEAEYDRELELDVATQDFMLERMTGSRKREGELKAQRAVLQANGAHEEQIRLLLEQLEETKEEEFKAVLRAQQYSRNLQEMDRSHIETLQGQKKAELDTLQLQGEELERQEAEFERELKQMEHQALELAQARDAEEQRLASLVKQNDRNLHETQFDEQRQLAMQHGSRMAELKMERSKLAEDRHDVNFKLDQLRHDPAGGGSGALRLAPAALEETVAGSRCTRLTLRLQKSMADIPPDSDARDMFVSAFKEDTAAVSGLKPDRVSVVKIEDGSVAVTFDIVEGAGISVADAVATLKADQDGDSPTPIAGSVVHPGGLQTVEPAQQAGGLPAEETVEQMVARLQASQQQDAARLQALRDGKPLSTPHSVVPRDDAGLFDREGIRSPGAIIREVSERKKTPQFLMAHANLNFASYGSIDLAHCIDFCLIRNWWVFQGTTPRWKTRRSCTTFNRRRSHRSLARSTNLGNHCLASVDAPPRGRALIGSLEGRPRAMAVMKG